MAAPGLVPATAAAQFQLGLQDPDFTQTLGSGAPFAFQTLNAIHGTTIRITVAWSQIAPQGPTRPVGFDATNPADPQYRWAATDFAVRSAAQSHANIMLKLTRAPQWAQPAGQPPQLKAFPGAWNPNAAEFGQFARAVALRYSGQFPDPRRPGTSLPGVTLWEIWNEENLPYDLTSLHPVAEYRALLNAGYSAIKAVHTDNVVALGGLAPVSFIPGVSISPLTFAADLLCLRRRAIHFVRNPNCHSTAHFDVLAIHPYSLAATPTKHAARYDDVLTADMGKLNALLDAAARFHLAAPTFKHQIWVTEWSWFTNPPDTQFGDADRLAARYVSYSMYQLWHSGVSLLIWLFARDRNLTVPNSPELIQGGGLYTASGQPKLTLRAFRFPVVASVVGGQGFVWGRAPVAGPSQVTVQRASGGRWIVIASVRTGPDGVFYLPLRARSNGLYRALLPDGELSLAYDSKPIAPLQTHSFSTS